MRLAIGGPTWPSMQTPNHPRCRRSGSSDARLSIEKRRHDGSPKLDYSRVVSKQGKPGKGLGKRSPLVVRKGPK